MQLNALLRWVRGLYHVNPTLFTIVASPMTWFGGKTAVYTYEHFLDYLLHTDVPHVVKLKLTSDQAKQVAEQVITIQHSKVGDTHVQGVYRELQTDSVIAGVGIAPSHTAPPAVIVPRSEFAARAAGRSLPAVREEKREIAERAIYTIIRPVLKEHGGGRWRLRGSRGEFSAAIEDHEFLDEIAEGSISAPLAAGTEMDADTVITEELEDGVWKPVAHRVVKVYDVKRRPSQAPLSLPPGEKQ